MKAEKDKSAPVLAAEVRQALDALRDYQRGSPRGLLRPLDQAAAVASKDPEPARVLEDSLLSALTTARHAVAREYICSALSLIGSAKCVPAMAALLADADLGNAARNVLERIPDRAAEHALVASLKTLQGDGLIGAINSLGARGTTGPERDLARKLRDSDPAIIAAAAAALGEIGSTKSARLLQALLGTAPPDLRPQVLEAARVCAEKLLANGKQREAKTLLAKISAA